MRKKLLPLPILLMFVFSVFSVNITGVSALDYPAIMVVPEITTGLEPGTNFTVSIYTDYYWFDIIGYQFTLNYNPSVLEGIEVVNGDVIVGGTPGSPQFEAGTFNNTEGTLSLTVGYFFTKGDIAWGPGNLAYVTFQVKDTGASTITLGPQTKLYGYDVINEEKYVIINAAEQPNNIQHGYFRNIPESDVIHDIAVTSVTPFPTSVLNSSSVDVTVVIGNEGNVNEAFNVTTYANTTTIETKTVTNLGSGLTKSLTFTWDTTGATLGDYTIKAETSTVPGDAEPGDNTLESVEKVNVKEPIYLPVAVILTEETVAYANKTLIFDGGNSTDPDGGTIIAFEWDFDDGTTATGQDVTHAYTTIGLYNVTLTVTDSQNQVSDPPAKLEIEIEEYPPEPPAYFADLVKWKVKPEAHSWDYSKDLATDDGLLTLTALATNLGTNDVNVTITFDILDAKYGTPVGPAIVETATLEVSGGDVPKSVLLDPWDYEYNEAKIVLFAQVTLEYYDADAETWIPASTKIIRFAIVP